MVRLGQVGRTLSSDPIQLGDDHFLLDLGTAVDLEGEYCPVSGSNHRR